MSDYSDPEEAAQASRRQYARPHSGKHPIPTVQRYREHRKELRGQQQETEEAQRGPEDESKPKRAFESAKAVFKGEDHPESEFDPYSSVNRNYGGRPTKSEEQLAEEKPQGKTDGSQDGVITDDDTDDASGGGGEEKKGKKDKGEGKSATEAVAGAVDPKEKRKAMKKTKRHGGGREVTDPVTHLPIIIHDQTEKDLNYAPRAEPEPGTDHRTATGVQGASKSDDELQSEKDEIQRIHDGMEALFPPPDFRHVREELAAIYRRALYAGLAAVSVLAFTAQLLFWRSGGSDGISASSVAVRALGLGVCIALAVTAVIFAGQWLSKRASDIFDEETWRSAKKHEREVLTSEKELPESVQWLNSLLSSIWPLINPDLFASLVDQLEDVMQASLPKAVKMVSVDDMGQGSEAIRIMGVRWLPTGAASRSVDSKGHLQKRDQSDAKKSDRTNPDDGVEQPSADEDGQDRGGEKEDAGNGDSDNKQKMEDQVAIREGMEAEEGDFINMELGFAYRPRSSGKSLRSKAKNAHLYLKFYLPGGIAVPVWVEVRGIVGIARVRLQLTPDPPFISLCTLTFMGQPRASLACVPLSKHSLNLMDVPLLSSFVQSAIDAALAEYVAPKSLTLNLKDMLVGEDFKKNTTSRGVVWIFIKSARGFKQGDNSIGPKQGSSDAYVTISWGKFGKPVASTRIIEAQQEPSWHEYASILVTPEELNADERLRLQLWDSDKWTADDDLGRVEVSLKELMNDRETCNRIQNREDRFTGEDAEEKMPGHLVWSVGYFSKTRITDEQLQHQTVNEDIRTKQQMKDHVSQLSENKLRESGKPPSDPEVQQQKAQDYKELEDDMIISAAPPGEDFVSGILSVQIHNITGLETQRLNKSTDEAKEDKEATEEEHSDDMPDSYCNIVLNHTKVYRTRIKPKNSKPFFNAGTERFVRDWRTAEVVVAVRDSREREDDPLIGLVYLPLARVFSKRSQVMDNFPLVGGIGYGRARISLVWRSVELRLPPNLRGWDFGTLEIKGRVKAKDDLPKGLVEHRIKLRSNMGRVKMYPVSDEDGGASARSWQLKKKKKQQKQQQQDGQEDQDDDGEDSAFLPVRKRYASAMVIEFRESKVGPDKTAAFAVLWLNELVDEEDKTVTLKVWKGGKDKLKKAETCCDYDGRTGPTGDEEEKDEEEIPAKPLGEIEVKVRFWRGLSGYHKSYAAKSKNGNMRDVMECLDTIADEDLESGSDDSDSGEDTDSSSSSEEESKTRKKLKVHTNDSDSTPSGSDDERGSELNPSRSVSDVKKGLKNIFRSPVDGVTTAAAGMVGAGGHNDPDDGKRGIRGEMKDYRDHHRQLHRKHRGVMQWRAARQAEHLGGKLGQLKGGAERLFSHSDKDTGVETEV